MGAALSRRTSTHIPLRPINTVAIPPATMSSVKNLVENQIAQNPVVVYSKSWCPYCRQTKQTLTDFGASFQVYELDQVDDGEEIQDYLAQKTGQRTVPNVFIERKHIGGNSDLQKIKNAGKLKDLLVHAGAASS